MPKPMLSPYQLHVNKWSNCRECSLCETRKHVVLYRGQVPCDVLFIGEAPGSSEDVIGQPFIGPAGKQLDALIGASLYNPSTNTEVPLRRGFTNLVCCIPKAEDTVGFVDPPKESIKACANRLLQIFTIANPKLVVCVGDLAWKWHDKILQTEGIVVTKITHPAAILRADITQRDIMKQRVVATLKEAFYEVKKGLGNG